MIEYFFMVLPFRRQSGFAVVNANRQKILGENLYYVKPGSLARCSAIAGRNRFCSNGVRQVETIRCTTVGDAITCDTATGSAVAAMTTMTRPGGRVPMLG